LKEILTLSLNEVSWLIKNQKVSPVELVNACLKQIDEVDSYLLAYIDVLYEESIQVAKKMEKDIISGNRVSALHGIPITLKDNINLMGSRTTAGSKILENWSPKEDATVVSQLKDAGAIILGKTNLHEFAWGATGENPFYGTVKNPWDHTRIVAGSSSGSAAAVSAYTCFGSIGTDTGGSIRLPSAVCGLVGMRPTHSRISNHGVIPLAPSMDTVGPITRTVKDNALLFEAINCSDKDKNISIKSNSSKFTSTTNNLESVHIGIIEEYFDNAQNSVMDSMKETIHILKTLGATVNYFNLESINLLKQTKDVIQLSEASRFHKKWIDSRIDDYGEDVKQRLIKGQSFSELQYLEAKHYSKLIKQEMLEIFKYVDIVLCPTTPFTAPKIGKRQIELKNEDKKEISNLLSYFTSLASVSGLPALNIPSGFDENNLPIGVQLIGKPYNEVILYHVGEMFQNATDHHLQKPNISFP